MPQPTTPPKPAKRSAAVTSTPQRNRIDVARARAVRKAPGIVVDLLSEHPQKSHSFVDTLRLNEEIARELCRDKTIPGGPKIAKQILKCCRILSAPEPTAELRPTWYCRNKRCFLCRRRIGVSIGKDFVNRLPAEGSWKYHRFVVDFGDPVDQSEAVEQLKDLNAFVRGCEIWFRRLNEIASQGSIPQKWKPKFAERYIHSFALGLHVQVCRREDESIAGFRPHLHLDLLIERDVATRFIHEGIRNWFRERCRLVLRPSCKSMPMGRWHRSLTDEPKPLSRHHSLEPPTRDKPCSTADIQRSVSYAVTPHSSDTCPEEYEACEKLFRAAGVDRTYDRQVVQLNADSSNWPPSERKNLAHEFAPLALKHSDLQLAGFGTPEQRRRHACTPEAYDDAVRALKAFVIKQLADYV